MGEQEGGEGAGNNVSASELEGLEVEGGRRRRSARGASISGKGHVPLWPVIAGYLDRGQTLVITGAIRTIIPAVRWVKQRVPLACQHRAYRQAKIT